MDFDLLTAFNPRILDVINYGESFWVTSRYEISQPATLLNVLAWVSSGKGMYQLDDIQDPLSPGCLFQVAPGRRLRITSSLRSPLHFISVRFTYGLVRWTGSHQIAMQEAPRLRPPLPFPLLVPELDRARMSDAFTRLFHIWQAKENGYEWYTRVALLDLVEAVSREVQTAAPSWDQAAGKVHAATEFIKLRFPDRISREDLARHVSLSPSYFSTVFRQFTGYGPMQYLAKVRVEAAKGLLRDSSLPVHEVAQAVGFTDPYYFARVFKRQTGLSAQEYRRS